MIFDSTDALLRQVEKPGRYTGGEYGEIKKEKKEGEVSFAFCFPDVYEIGMSNLGMKILYSVLNSYENIRCERCFSPWPDAGELLVSSGLTLSTLESRQPLNTFDMIGFSMGYELCYTNVLYMLKLSGLPLLASDRDDSMPLVIGGGVCTYNPEPIADFFDVFSIGEGEESLPAFVNRYSELRKLGLRKKEILRCIATEMADMGIYVPSLYNVEYNADGTISAFTPLYKDIPKKIKKAVISDLDNVHYPTKPVVPFIEAVHDRVMLEVARGCMRGCRFCQAGMVCRPYREKSADTLNNLACRLVNSTGYNEISMMSLSISDYSELSTLTDLLLSWTDEKHVSLSLPSMRVDSFYKELMEKVMSVRKSGITFAPEAGSQRLRDVINKNITEEEILKACETAFECGKSSIKLYFMNGLPTETDEDILAIAQLGQSVLNCFFNSPNRKKGMSMSITLSVACFVPKPFTPFQWEAQNSTEELLRKQMLLKHNIPNRRISYNYHDSAVSRLEAVFARGNRRLSKLLALACEKGFIYDSWDEFYKKHDWDSLFAEAGLEPAFYANRKMGYNELLPWDFIDIGVTKEYLLGEAVKAEKAETTPDCGSKCSACGASVFAPEKNGQLCRKGGCVCR